MFPAVSPTPPARHPVARAPVRDALIDWLIAQLGITIDGTDVPESAGNITIDGTDVTEVTVDGTTVWTADAIPDSAVWQIDATSLSVSDGSGVTSWDVGIAGGSITGGSPTYDADGMNGNPLVDGNGVDDYLSGDDSALPLSNNARTIIIVHRVETIQTEYLFEYGRSDNGGERWTMQVRDNGEFRVGIVNEAQLTDPVYSASTNYITSIRYAQGDSLGQADVRIGQTDEAFTTSNGSATVGTVSDTVDVFDADRRDGPTDGGISEAIVYDTDLSDTVWTDEIDRLANKWGITV